MSQSHKADRHEPEEKNLPHTPKVPEPQPCACCGATTMPREFKTDPWYKGGVWHCVNFKQCTERAESNLRRQGITF